MGGDGPVDVNDLVVPCRDNLSVDGLRGVPARRNVGIGRGDNQESVDAIDVFPMTICPGKMCSDGSEFVVDEKGQWRRVQPSSSCALGDEVTKAHFAQNGAYRLGIVDGKGPWQVHECQSNRPVER